MVAWWPGGQGELLGHQEVHQAVFDGGADFDHFVHLFATRYLKHRTTRIKNFKKRMKLVFLTIRDNQGLELDAL